MKKLIPLLFIILFLNTCNTNNKDFILSEKERKAGQDLSFKGRLDMYKKSYDYFKKEMQEEEFVFLWLTLFKNYTYVLDGNLKNREADCLSAYWYFFSKVGSNVILEDIPSIMNRVRKLSELKQIKIYKDGDKVYNGGLFSIRAGDVIIFHIPNAKINYHIVVVYSKSGDILQYMEMGGPVMKANYNSTNFNNGNIAMIFSPSYAYWIGDSFYVDNTDGAMK